MRLWRTQVQVPFSLQSLSTKLRGFFNATQRRVLAHVSWGVLKKPTDSHRELFERLWVRRTKEEVDVVDNPREGKATIQEMTMRSIGNLVLLKCYFIKSNYY